MSHASQKKYLQHHRARKKMFAGAHVSTPLRLNEMNQRFSAASLKDRSRISTSIENSWLSRERWSPYRYRVLSRAISSKRHRNLLGIRGDTCEGLHYGRCIENGTMSQSLISAVDMKKNESATEFTRFYLKSSSLKFFAALFKNFDFDLRIIIQKESETIAFYEQYMTIILQCLRSKP